MIERVCSVKDVEPDTAIRVEVGGTAVALVRIGDDFYAINDRCSHADVSLSLGEVDPGDCHIECWKHGSRFSLKTGIPDVLPATKPVAVYAVTVDGDDVLVEVPAS
jgi:3-phenylpropionate/trans-cinnamate dioxygenase ferredoxin subunit